MFQRAAKKHKTFYVLYCHKCTDSIISRLSDNSINYYFIEDFKSPIRSYIFIPTSQVFDLKQISKIDGVYFLTRIGDDIPATISGNDLLSIVNKDKRAKDFIGKLVKIKTGRLKGMSGKCTYSNKNKLHVCMYLFNGRMTTVKNVPISSVVELKECY